jgi:flavodoxin
MKALIICMSVHHGNTKKVAERMARVLEADVVQPGAIDNAVLKNYGVIGFGSGIYFGRFHRSLAAFVEKLPDMKGKKAFVFSTSGPGGLYNTIMKRGFSASLRGKGFEIMGEFSCPGWDTYGAYSWIGGLCKGRPGDKDLLRAEEFAKEMKAKMRIG